MALERIQDWPSLQVLFGDTPLESVKAARSNASSARASICIVRWDAHSPPLASGSLTLLTTNLAYGKDVSLRDQSDEFLSQSFQKIARVFHSGGRAVLLSIHHHLIRRSCTRRHLMRCAEELPIQLNGFDTSINMVLERL